jgi:hypothetical protein
MKTAGRENPNRRATVPDNRAPGAAGQEQILLNQVGCEARKIPAVGEIFFLTSTFIELTRRLDSSRAERKDASSHSYRSATMGSTRIARRAGK